MRPNDVWLPLALFVLLIGGPAVGADYALPVTGDNSIVDVNGERDVNMGAATSLRLKAHQHHLVVRVDASDV